jgi:hypothetical protein
MNDDKELKFRLLEMSIKILNENIDRKLQVYEMNREAGKPTPPLTQEFINPNDVTKVASRLYAFIREK